MPDDEAPKITGQKLQEIRDYDAETGGQVWAQQSQQLSSLPSLASMGTVEAYVRRFLAGIFHLRALWEGGEVDGEAAAKDVIELCRSGGEVFLGVSAEYHSLPWNSEPQLGGYLCRRFGYQNPEEAPFQLFLTLAQFAVEKLELGAEGKLRDYLLRAELDDGVNLVVGALLGLVSSGPPHEEKVEKASDPELPGIYLTAPPERTGAPPAMLPQ